MRQLCDRGMSDGWQAKVDDIRSKVVSENTKNVYSSCLVKYLSFLLNSKSNLLTEDFKRHYSNLTGKRLKNALWNLLSEKTSEKSIIPLHFESLKAEDFFKWSISNLNKDGTYLSPSSYGMHCSAIHHLYRLFKADIPKKFDHEISELSKGLRREISLQVQHGIGKITVGKDPLDFHLYQYLSRYLLKKGTTDSIFSHLFLTLTWNLMCRAGSTVSICISHLDWKNDALHVYFAHQKNDQMGEKPRDPRHVYANPVIPEICPILSLGIFLLSFPNVSLCAKLFQGDNQYERFRKILQSTVKEEECKTELLRRGIVGDDLGTHSIRKGAATFCSSGSTACPPPVAIHLRAGWALGGVQDTYMRYQAAGDQHVGRTVSGLPSHSVQFAILPPHFKFESETDQKVLDDIIDACCPGIPIQMRLVVQFALASVVFHADFLQKILGDRHPVFFSPLFANNKYLNLLKNCVVCNLNESNGTMVATGIPPHISLLTEMHCMRSELLKILPKIENVPDAVVKGVVVELEKRAIGASTVTTDGLKEMLQLTLKEAGLLDVFNKLKSLEENSLKSVNKNNEVQFPDSNTFLINLPKNFDLPSSPPHTMWMLWHFGNSQQSIPPLKGLRSYHLSSRLAKQKLNDLQSLMRSFSECLQSHGKYIENPSLAEASDMAAFACDKLFIESHHTPTGSERRINQIAWRTALNQHRAQKRASNPKKLEKVKKKQKKIK